MTTKQKILIGRQDVADFPLLNILQLPIKIDTGAYTSSLHCHNIIEFEENGQKRIKCNLLDPEHENYHEKEITFDAFTKKKVKSSNGQVEERYKITTEIVLFNQTFPIEFTLSERGSMRFSVLIGRKFLTNRFIVDTSLKNLSLKNNIILY
ncbi:MAG: RimK/LysX family protein [Flavobacteriales bacterium]|nr:RimK/LysX family protein [Flavobacteriales bacterium]MCW8912379.1 RimK/LysX family protein [Flavobacteriales bacterium]MCW8936463.1 RimK/LysX family protein [Flavobacteriales bacterium]MCW8941080.1 RimK/LysX family protein [Flavobacteriales bacterium]MCW8967529.1 RimK/LysX family protein [Flavobacteriales bacterium]